MSHVTTYRPSTFNAAADGAKPGRRFIRCELDHLLGQFLREPARESLVGRNDA